ncbi:MAG: ABC transporter substrate-binding protein [Actinomycetota bacterium]
MRSSTSSSTPHRLRLVAAFVALTLLAAACGGDDESGDGPASDSSTASASDSASASASAADPAPEEDQQEEESDEGGDPADEEPAVDEEPEAAETPADLRATDQRGVEVTLDEPPLRVVSVWDSIDAQNLLALGIEPVLIGRVNEGRPAPWLDDYAGIETYDLGAGPSVELLATYQPDLIVIASYDPDSYPLLEEIAPLYVADNSIPWRDEIRSLAALVGRTTEAEALIASHEAAIAEAAAALADWQGATLFAAAVTPSSELTAFTDTSPISALLVELGLAPLVASIDGSNTQSYSLELIGDLEGDAFLLVDVSGLAGFDLEQLNQDFLGGPLIGTMPAAADGVYRISAESSAALRLVNAANLPYLLDELVRVLTGAPTQ